MALLRNARIPCSLLPDTIAAGFPPGDPDLDPACAVDVRTSGGLISSLAPAGSLAATTGETIHDAAGRLTFPGFADAHTHLDKAHSWGRAPNRRHEFWEAIRVLSEDKRHWSAEDLHRRARFALRSAWAHGTVALRTHVDSPPGTREVSHAAMAALRAEWAGRIAIQTVPLCGLADYSGPQGQDIADVAVRHGASALGGMPQMNPDLDRQLDRLLDLAAERQVGIDLHVDENLDATAETLAATARAVLRRGFTGPVACGHCCSLSIQDPATRQRTVDLVREARIHIISLPLCNLYLQDRAHDPARTPVRRGITLLHEFIDAGVPVVAASDNVRDAFYAYGDLDPLEVLVQSVRIGHLDSRLQAASRLVTSAAGDAMGLPAVGRVAPGSPGTLVITSARTFSELLSRPAAPRRILDGDGLTTRTPPDYSELD